MTEYTPDTAAPLPRDPYETTARQLADHAAARVLYLSSAVQELLVGANPDDAYFRAMNTMIGQYATAYLVRALIAHAPDHADQVVQGLLADMDDGASPTERAGEWADRAGLDPDGLYAAGQASAQAKRERTHHHTPEETSRD